MIRVCRPSSVIGPRTSKRPLESGLSGPTRELPPHRTNTVALGSACTSSPSPPQSPKAFIEWSSLAQATSSKTDTTSPVRRGRSC